MNVLVNGNIDNGITEEQKNPDFIFLLFCVWTFTLLCRPQDIFPLLAPLRPILLMSALTFTGMLVSGALFRGPSFFAERQVKLYVALLLIMVIGIPFSLYTRLSFMTIFTGYTNVVLYFIIFYKLVDSEKRISSVLTVACIGTGLYLAYSVKMGSIENGRLVFGSMFDANDLAFFALSFSPLNLIFISRRNPLWKRLACLGCFAVSVLLIVLTGSRGGLLAFSMVGVLLIFHKGETITLPMKVIFIVLCFVILGLPSVNMERYTTIFNLEQDYNVQGEEGRLAIWEIGKNIILTNPLTGVGVGCFGEAVGIAREAQGADSRAWQTAHNSAVQIGAETGVMGLSLYLFMSLEVLRIFNRARKTAISKVLVKISEMGLAGFIGLFISGMFLSQAYSIYWAFYVVLSAVINLLVTKQKNYL